MSSILDNRAVRQAALPISVKQYHQLGDAGIIAQNTELLQGVIIEKMIKSPQHTWMVQFLAGWLRGPLGEEHHVRQEQPLTLTDSEPEPDIAVVIGIVDDYRSQHPTTADLVIEIAISSADIDREKAGLNSAADVKEYWLVLANQGIVEVHRGPCSTGFTQKAEFTRADAICPRSIPGSMTLELCKLFY